MDDVFPYSMHVEDRSKAKFWTNIFFEAEVSYAVTQDFPYTIWMSEAAFSALKEHIVVVGDE